MDTVCKPGTDFERSLTYPSPDRGTYNPTSPPLGHVTKPHTSPAALPLMLLLKLWDGVSSFRLLVCMGAEFDVESCVAITARSDASLHHAVSAREVDYSER